MKEEFPLNRESLFTESNVRRSLELPTKTRLTIVLNAHSTAKDAEVAVREIESNRYNLVLFEGLGFTESSRATLKALSRGEAIPKTKSGYLSAIFDALFESNIAVDFHDLPQNKAVQLRNVKEHYSFHTDVRTEVGAFTNDVLRMAKDVRLRELWIAASMVKMVKEVFKKQEEGIETQTFSALALLGADHVFVSALLKNINEQSVEVKVDMNNKLTLSRTPRLYEEVLRDAKSERFFDRLYEFFFEYFLSVLAGSKIMALSENSLLGPKYMSQLVMSLPKEEIKKTVDEIVAGNRNLLNVLAAFFDKRFLHTRNAVAQNGRVTRIMSAFLRRQGITLPKSESDIISEVDRMQKERKQKLTQ